MTSGEWIVRGAGARVRDWCACGVGERAGGGRWVGVGYMGGWGLGIGDWEKRGVANETFRFVLSNTSVVFDGQKHGSVHGGHKYTPSSRLCEMRATRVERQSRERTAARSRW